jgi:dienelactone hydrolase
MVFLIGSLSDSALAQSVKFKSASQDVDVIADLYRPAGDGPFSAVILLHTCGGVGKKEPQYAMSLRSEGYLTVVPDSFASRGNKGKGNRCTPGNYENHVSDSVSDSIGAAAYLRSLPFVRRDRIAVIGMSLGGTATLALPGNATEQGIRAAISYYPPCVLPDGKHFFKESRIPLLLFLGELDNWSPTAKCVAKAEEIQRSGRIVEWMVYSGTHHGFDNQDYYFAVNDSRGRTMQHNQSAADDSWKRLKLFLTKHLDKEP